MEHVIVVPYLFTCSLGVSVLQSNLRNTLQMKKSFKLTYFKSAVILYL